MNFRLNILVLIFSPMLLSAATFPAAGTDGPSQRAYQIAVMSQIVDPVLVAGSNGLLTPGNIPGPKRSSAPLEALARTVVGIAPWLELGSGENEEGKLRAHYTALALTSIQHTVDPASPSFVNLKNGQTLVDTAFLAQGLLRAPKQLWGGLDNKTRARIIEVFKSTRVIKAPDNNWLLFSAMIETSLLEFTGECEMAPIEKAVSKHLEWYKGDGTYGDGKDFHWDYYNSYVIQPMLLEILEVLAKKKLPLEKYYPATLKRFQRYAVIQERMISPEGTYPIIGRSSTYRFGALQVLSLAALRNELPEELSRGGVRAALNAVIHRMIEAPGTFDEKGWLNVGVVGKQPSMADNYISTGSLYLLTTGLLQLGLPANDPFWTEPSKPWTQQKIWNGDDLPGDHCLIDK